MKKIVVLSILTLLIASCKKEVASYYSENFSLDEDVTYTINPENGSMVKKIIVSTTDFVANYRERIEAEQEVLGRDIYDFEVRIVNFSRFHAGSFQSLENNLSSVNLFFDKNDGSAPIKIATAEALNVDMGIIQSDLLELTSLNPNYIMYFTAEFDQVPTDTKSVWFNGNLDVSVSFKYKRK